MIERDERWGTTQRLTGAAFLKVLNVDATGTRLKRETFILPVADERSQSVGPTSIAIPVPCLELGGIRVFLSRDGAEQNGERGNETGGMHFAQFWIGLLLVGDFGCLLNIWNVIKTSKISQEVTALCYIYTIIGSGDRIAESSQQMSSETISMWKIEGNRVRCGGSDAILPSLVNSVVL